MKTIAYTALHYGADYLAYAIRSVIDHVDEYHAIYTPIGSHGHRTTEPCPDTRDQLYAIAEQAAGHKLHWHEGIWPYEGAQREAIHQYVPDADVILVLDADEIWHEALAPVSIGFYRNCLEHGTLPPHGRIRLPIIHYWRSFHHCILHDPAFPIRVIYPKAPQNEAAMGSNDYSGWGYPEPVNISHMGYAQRSEIVRYKLLTHGHKNEFRRDVDWFNDVFMANRQQDTHPVGSEYWNPETVNPVDYMPAWMSEHPYFGMDVIP